jgi:hypothetical protein
MFVLSFENIDEQLILLQIGLKSMYSCHNAIVVVELTRLVNEIINLVTLSRNKISKRVATSFVTVVLYSNKHLYWKPSKFGYVRRPVLICCDCAEESYGIRNRLITILRFYLHCDRDIIVYWESMNQRYYVLTDWKLSIQYQNNIEFAQMVERERNWVRTFASVPSQSKHFILFPRLSVLDEPKWL